MTIERALEEFGLAKSKATVYLAALAVGSGSTQEIANKANLPRTTVHEILQRLLPMGLVGFVNKGRTRVYHAEPPEKLKNLLQEKERKLEKVLPELRSLYNISDTKPKVRFYEGIEGIKMVFEDTLTTKERLLRGILSMADLYTLPGRSFMNHYVEKRIQAGIQLHVIRSEIKDVEETWPTSDKEKRELHYAPKEMTFPMTIYLYDNKVGIIGTEKKHLA